MAVDLKFGPGLATLGNALSRLGRKDAALAAYELALSAPDAPDSPQTVPEDWRSVVPTNKADMRVTFDYNETATMRQR
jgi:hypothetical protein